MNKTRTWMIAAMAAVLGACATAPKDVPLPANGGGNLSGNWVLTTESQMGAQDANMTVSQTGMELAGTVTGQAGSVPYTGTLQGAAVAFAFTIKVQGTDLKLDYTGTVEGDTMKGKAVFGQFGEGTFTAKRQ